MFEASDSNNTEQTEPNDGAFAVGRWAEAKLTYLRPSAADGEIHTVSTGVVVRRCSLCNWMFYFYQCFLPFVPVSAKPNGGISLAKRNASVRFGACPMRPTSESFLLTTEDGIHKAGIQERLI